MKFEGALRDEFKKAIRYWADNNPGKNQPLLSLGNESATPLEIADAVEKETAFGLKFIEFVEKVATDVGESAENIIARFNRPPQP